MEALNPVPPGREHWVVSPQRAAAEWVGGYRGSTRSSYGRALRAWLWWCEDSHLDPWSVSRIHIERYLATMPPKAGQAAATAICGFYRDAHGRGLTRTDLAWGVRRPRVGRGPAGTFATPDELRRILATTRTVEDVDVRALVSTLIVTGFRLGETLALDVADCDTTDGVRVTLRRKHGHTDILPLPSPAREDVAALLSRRTTGPVFRHRGRRMDAHTARRWVTAIAEEAGCEQRITPHSLRRSFVTLARDLGLEDAEIMAMTGHVDASMIDFYDRGRRQRDGAAGREVAAWLEQA